MTSRTSRRRYQSSVRPKWMGKALVAKRILGFDCDVGWKMYESIRLRIIVRLFYDCMAARSAAASLIEQFRTLQLDTLALRVLSQAGLTTQTETVRRWMTAIVKYCYLMVAVNWFRRIILFVIIIIIFFNKSWQTQPVFFWRGAGTFYFYYETFWRW